jgi:hypothetical protein
VAILSRGFKGKIKVKMRRSADAKKVMSEWREKSDRRENISSDSILKSIHH